MKEEAEKEAKRLHLRFLLKLPFDKEVATENKHGKWTYDSEELAKEHALICVDEIIEVARPAKTLPPNQRGGKTKEFYLSVRAIIEAQINK